MRQYRRRKRVAVLSIPEPVVVPPPPEQPVVPGVPVYPDEPAEAVAQWAQTLTIPDGLLQGEHFRIADWKLRFLRDTLAPGTREACLSVARKNGKSALCALLLLAYLSDQGPLHRHGWRGLVVSLTGQLAIELRHQIEAIAAASGLAVEVRKAPYPGQVLGPDRCKVTILASDRGTGHGLGVDLAIIDELGLIPEAKRDLINAVKSSTSARDGRVIAISIRGDSPFMGEIEERAKSDPAVVFHEYAAPADCKLDDEEAWHKANPGLGTIKSYFYMVDSSRAALATPADQSAHRALNLNAPVDPSREVIILPQQWDECVTDSPPELDGECLVGLDIGGAASLSPCVAIWPRTSRMEVWGAFADTPDLHSRGQADGIGRLYERMQEAGELQIYPGRVTDVPAFLEDCADRLAGENVIACGADRYRRSEVLQSFERANISWPLVWRGVGHSATEDGSADVRSFQRLALSGKLKCSPSLMMQAAIADSKVIRDTSGNPKLDKARRRGRIDALSAGVIAAGLSELHSAKPRRRYRSMVLS